MADTSTDTIYALSSGAGLAGVSVVRVSGAYADALLTSLGVSPLPEARYAALHKLRSDGDGPVIDQALILRFPAPGSFTGEDVAELHVHGGRAVLAAVFDAISATGLARHAEPGEFTRRAFTNGRLDLTQAEAVADVIDSASDKALSSAIAQLKGGLSHRLNNLHETLLNAQAQLEASIDFTEDGLTFQSRETTQNQIREVETNLRKLVDSFRQGRIYREGMRVTLVGKPNVGKSSLLNALLQEDRAIVTAYAGTTRDTLEERARIKDIHIIITDSAGLRDNPEVIE